MSACCSCSPTTDSATEESTPDSLQWLRLGIALAISGLSMIFGLGINFSPPTGLAYWILHSLLALAVLVVVLLSGYGLIQQGFKQLLALSPGVESLFLLGIVGAFGASLHSTLTETGDIYYEVVAILVTIYSLGSALTKRQQSRALQAVESLHSRYAQARLEDGKSIDSHQIQSGQRIVVRPGEGIPIDGKIIQGTALVHETPLTGEPFAVSKSLGDRVLAGSDNLDGELTIEAAVAGNQRQLDQLLDTLKSARLKQSRIQLEAHRIARIFFPVVITISVTTFIFWTFRGDWQPALFHALAVIVVACPCALGLATPLAIWSSINRLFRHGIITRQSDFVERLHQVDTIVFDKTGTLSKLQPELCGFHCLPDCSESDLKARIAAVQAEFKHPIAALFQKWDTDLPRPLLSKMVPGCGVQAQMSDDVEIYIGNEALLSADDLGSLHELQQQVSPNSRHRTIYIKQNGTLVALALYQEELRAETLDTIQSLKSAGYELHLYSGDRASQVAAVAPEGLSIEAELTPIEKKQRIIQLQELGKRVLFIGDGTNDAPTLEAAHASIAMHEGSDVAHQTSQAIIQTDRITPILSALQLSHRTMGTLKTNLFFATAYNLIGISLAATGILNPIWAALLMLVSSVTVSTRALRAAQQASYKQPLSAPQSSSFSKPSIVLRRPQILTAAGILFSAVLFSYAGNFSWQATVVTLTIACVMIWLVLRVLSQLTTRRQCCWASTAWCSAGMLAGWVIIAGWRPVVYDGVCLCGCADSPFGQGLVSIFNPMYMLMFALGFIAYIAVSPKKLIWPQMRAHLVCAILMCLAMWATSLWWSLIPVHPDAQLQFLLTAAAMFLSMFAALVGFEWLQQRSAGSSWFTYFSSCIR